MTKHLFPLNLTLLLFAALACLPATAMAAPVLGTELKSFAVLAGTTVTSSGATMLTGSLGVSPGTATTGLGPANYSGTYHSNDATSRAAHAQLATAITNLRKMGSGSALAGNLNGLTLAPGVYTVAALASNLSQTLTLDGGGNPNAYWVFLIPSTLITGANSVVKVINAGAGAGVYWVLGTSATLGAGTTFAGNILAEVTITMGEAVNLNCGRALAFNGAVTMVNDKVNSVDCTGSGVEGSTGLSGGLDVPAGGGAPVPVPPPSGGGNDQCSLSFNVPNHVAETSQAFTVTSVSSNSTKCLASESKVLNFACAYKNPASGSLPVRMGAAVALASNGAAPCSAGGANLTLDFNAAGVANAVLIYADAGQMALTASYVACASGPTCAVSATTTVIAGPARFAFGAVRQSAAPNLANPAAANDAGARFIKAGEAFSATISALNANNTPTANFGKEAAPEQIRLGAILVAPAGGAMPAMSGSFGPFTGGAASAANLAWSEVGIIALSASLANGTGYLGTSAAPSNLMVTGSSGNIGRFVPDHFDTAITPGVPMPCPRARLCPPAGFVYARQPFGVTLTARNLAGSTTANYALAYARAGTLAAWSAPGSTTLPNPPASPGGNSVRNAGVPAGAFLQGVASVTTPAYVFAAAFPATNLAPPTDIYLRASDTDGVTSLRSAGSVEGGLSVVSGRLQTLNNYGSEVLSLPLSVVAQFWDGMRFINSSTDSVSMFSRSSVLLNNCTRNLNSGSGCKPVLSVAQTPASMTLANGATRLTLNAPRAGNTGSADVRIDGVPYLPGAPGRATFGVYNAGPITYVRELY